MLLRQLDGPPDALPPQPPHPRAGPELSQPRPHLPGEAGLFQQMPPARTNSTGAPGPASRRAQFAPSSASEAAASARIFRARRSRFAAAAKTVRASAATSLLLRALQPSQSNRPVHSIATPAKCFPPRPAIGPCDPSRRPPPASLESDLITAASVAQNCPQPAQADRPAVGPCFPAAAQNSTTRCRSESGPAPSASRPSCPSAAVSAVSKSSVA